MTMQTGAPMEPQSPRKSASPIKEDSAWTFLAGPAFLLCTLAIASWVSSGELMYWLVASLIGMALCVCYRMRGCFYATLLLAGVSTLRHGWLLDHHLLSFGLEGSLACSFLITALSTDQRKSIIQSLKEMSLAQGQTIGHLEENVTKITQSAQAQQISLQEKIAEKEKELEEVQTELSSILVLNEVLRKTTASQLKESTHKAEALLDRDRRIGFLVSERNELQKQLDYLRNESEWVQENEKLIEELNKRRSEYAQLEVLYQNAKSVSERHSVSQDAEVLALENEALKAEIGKLQGLAETASSLLEEREKWRDERELYQENLSKTGRELAASEEEVSQLQSEKEVLREEIQSVREKINSLEALKEEQTLHLQEKEKLLSKQEELTNQLQERLSRLLDESLTLQENERLKESLHTKEYEHSQLKLQCQNVQHLYEKQSRHAEQTHQQLCAFSSEKQALQQQIGSLNADNQMLKTHLQQVSEELSESLTALQKLERLQEEKIFLQERLQKAELELAASSKKTNPLPSSAKENPSLSAEREALLAKLENLQSHLAHAEERVKKSSQVEALYQQLREQFEEKNAILHETRAELFQADTKLQALQMEKKQSELNEEFIPEDLRGKISSLEEEIENLKGENEQLQEIISKLSGGS